MQRLEATGKAENATLLTVLNAFDPLSRKLMTWFHHTFDGESDFYKCVHIACQCSVKKTFFHHHLTPAHTLLHKNNHQHSVIVKLS